MNLEKLFEKRDETLLKDIHYNYMEFFKNNPSAPFAGWLLTLTDDEFKLLSDQVGEVFENSESSRKLNELAVLTLIRAGDGELPNFIEAIQLMISDSNKEAYSKPSYVLINTILLVGAYKKGYCKFAEVDGVKDFDTITILKHFEFYKHM